MQTWETAWDEFSSRTGMGSRAGQMQMGREVMGNVTDGGQLVVQAPTGTGKSLAYLIPLVARAYEKERSVVSTETLTLLDQLVDKDLPMLQEIYGGFTFFGLKGRNHYLCHAKAGNSHPIAGKLRDRALGNGERRDVERVLGYEVHDDDWRNISSDTEHCSANQCNRKDCYAARARDLAEKADIVVTSHAMLRIHGATSQQDPTGLTDGILGDIKHIVVDEAHTLEGVFVDGGTIGLTPYELNMKTESVLKGTGVSMGAIEEAERLLRGGVSDIQTFMDKFRGEPPMREWQRESLRLGLYYIRTSGDPSLLTSLENYEVRGRERLMEAAKKYERLAKKFARELENADNGKRKIRSAMNASQYLANLSGLIGLAMGHKEALVEAYGTTYVMLADGWKARGGRFGAETKGVRLRSVPLDVSGFSRTTLWSQAKSVTLVSATMVDPLDGSFRYVRRSLGLDPKKCAELTVASPFDYAKQQMVYLTPGYEAPVDLPGARYSASELRSLLKASDGRALVLFTSRAELDHCAQAFRADKTFPWQLLVQDKDVRKQDLVEKFTSNVHSVLLATKSFFAGMNFEGTTCSLVVICKWPNPQYNDLTRSKMAYWKERGFPRWYESNAMQTFTQASGRLIRSTNDTGVVALLDNRVAEPSSQMAQSLMTALPALYPGSVVTNEIETVKSFFARPSLFAGVE